MQSWMGPRRTSPTPCWRASSPRQRSRPARSSRTRMITLMPPIPAATLPAMWRSNLAVPPPCPHHPPSCPHRLPMSRPSSCAAPWCATSSARRWPASTASCRWACRCSSAATRAVTSNWSRLTPAPRTGSWATRRERRPPTSTPPWPRPRAGAPPGAPPRPPTAPPHSSPPQHGCASAACGSPRSRSANAPSPGPRPTPTCARPSTSWSTTRAWLWSSIAAGRCFRYRASATSCATCLAASSRSSRPGTSRWPSRAA